MKTINLSLLGLLFSLVIYSQVQIYPRENGWYHITDGKQDSISKEPIVTLEDFVELKLEYDSFGKSVILGKISDLKRARWADATEKSIGKRIGFVFNDTVITDPQVNARIESGYFQISNPRGYDLERIYRQLLKEKEISTECLSMHLDTILYVDKTRNRSIPIAIYQPEEKAANNIPVIFSHGYGGNKGGDYLIYSYLNEFLASKGFFVVSIQHELPTDDLLPMTGELRKTRRSNWERGVQNIYFVISQIKRDYPNLDYEKLALIGHSNGGDMTIYFAHKYPDLVEKVISMDNRRMELPRTSNPQIFTLRSKDCPADVGVLPTNEEIAEYGITVQYTDINHSNMDNDASAEERKYLNNKIWEYLNK